MKVIFLGRKPYGSLALEYLVKKGFKVVYVVNAEGTGEVYWKQKVIDKAREYSLNVIDEKKLYQKIENKELNNIDLVLSFLYPKKIKKTLINLPRIAAINFHPGILPDYKGWATYNYAINQKLQKWGVSAHLIDEEFDTGGIIKIKKFSINHNRETALSLESKTQKMLYRLFEEVIDNVLKSKKIMAKKQDKKGVYISRQKLEKMKRFSNEDSLETINRKIRAFWFPPFDGLNLDVKGEKFTLINRDILKDISKKLHKKDLKK